ncbi:hypothetical protein GUITHDRAFT_87369 [Guillardia theta CCMP2712]|uniref:Choline/carnitine acyltransferase domain-containing protein n=1 Tax=Guillardia theta (strain CCMP2712) TaxID=905079 RepID=L1J801_GUITC|nr:hypothetical protein GUITHDRAFT_87369 [Guillardia theta CCMP2712]EKX44663.1 hypothetical protein GUITHDRAFT_87369 [Guillardia theta CCMP2712]|eukprot:XP_005831643.1 hypothetical protein GUITHDRAFT_87369 [Guillardia theta CCMP2712]
MWRHQGSVPQLPIPELESTVAKYLVSVRPLVSDEQFEATAKKAAYFLVNGDGKKLQERLLRRAAEKKGSSWLIDWWNDRAYLTDREPVVFFVSYFYLLKHAPLPLPHGQLLSASALVRTVCRFRDQVVSGSLQPDMIRNAPQCMAVYSFLFHTCRIPGSHCDVVASYQPEHNTHIVVARQGHLFKLELGSLQGLGDILEALGRIVEEADAAGEAEVPVGSLTSGERDVWAKCRTSLMEDKSNRASLEAIESSMFLVCLDHLEEAGVVSRSRQMWHGDGKNRWYDKTLQFVVLPCGQVGFLGEHAISDGAPTLRLCEFVGANMAREVSAGESKGRGSKLELSRLGFNLSRSVVEAHAQIRAQFVKLVESHEASHLVLSGMGRDGIKALKMPPDAFVQLAIQLAFFRMHGRVTATYEACSTRRFLHGRTETIRSCSLEGKRFVEAMASGLDHRTQYNYLQAAVRKHQQTSNECSNARGVDRHLLGLRLSLHEGEAMPELFSDPSFATSSSWELSTSHLFSEHLQSWGFGQVVPHGFGVGYSINRAESVFFITCQKQAADRSSLLSREIQRSVQDMQKLCNLYRGISNL